MDQELNVEGVETPQLAAMTAASPAQGAWLAPPAPTIQAHVREFGEDHETTVDDFIRSVARLQHLYPSHYPEEQLIRTAIGHLSGEAYDHIVSLPGYEKLSLEELGDILRRQFELGDDYDEAAEAFHSMKKSGSETLQEFRVRITKKAKLVMRLRPTEEGENEAYRKKKLNRLIKTQFLRGLPDSVRKMLIGREQDDFESLIRIIEKYLKFEEKEKIQTNAVLLNMGQQMEKAHQQPAQGNFGPPWAHAGEHPAGHQQP
ncbi:Hypothetical predicted protein [Cloeon dipterum]|uniref:Uncharacterized protein n=1 Tax=Cloeon dipterum TaxID=197152 RepID=A0A8S1DZB9_9INSE|nr:Hypothetical predicted protein [Cloeon dipterum]